MFSGFLLALGFRTARILQKERDSISEFGLASFPGLPSGLSLRSPLSPMRVVKIATAVLRFFRLWFYFLVHEVLLALWLLWTGLLGLQPGFSQPQHLIHSISRRNGRRWRRRPPRRTVRRWLRRRLLRLVIPCVVRWCFKLAGLFLQTLWGCLRCRVRERRERNDELLAVSPSERKHVTRFASTNVNLDLHGWSDLPQDRMRSTVLEALRAWCMCVTASPLAADEWSSFVELCLPDSVKAILRQSEMLQDVIRTVAVVCQLLEPKHVTWEHVQSFTVITRSLADWIFPSNRQSTRSTHLETDLLWIVGGCCRLLLITAWQATGGKRKRARAIRRCVGLDPVLKQAFLHCHAWSGATKTAVAQFVCLHVLCVLKPIPGHAVLYQLASSYREYVGSTKFGASKTACRGDAPVQRSYQHVLEHHKFRLGNKRGRTTPKLRLFGRLHACDHMFWVLAVSTEPHVRALEDAAIRCWQKSGNCRSTGGSLVARARHSVASRQGRNRPTCRYPFEDISCFVAHQTQWLRVSNLLYQSRIRPNFSEECKL